MKEKRYFYDGELNINKIIKLEGDEFHHLTNVMRTRVGEDICLFNGNGNFYFGVVLNIQKKFAEIEIKSIQNSLNEPTINLTVYQALAKGDKLSLIMQKITEIGATNLCLFESKFTDVKASNENNKFDRLKNITISAAKQCGRATLVKTNGIFNINQIAKEIINFDKFFIAYENSENRTLVNELFNLNSNDKNIAIMIGAEGGFADDEIKLLEKSGAIIISLGKRILRTETASIACTALITQILENK